MAIDITTATNVVIEPSFLGEPDNLCLPHDTEISNLCHQSTRGEETVLGNIHIQVMGRPGQITNREICVLQDTLVLVYNNLSSQMCRIGYRHLAGARSIGVLSPPSQLKLNNSVLNSKLLDCA